MVAVACESFVSRRRTYMGMILYRGEYWSAHCANPVVAEQRVVIAGRVGLLLEVIAPKPMSTGAYR